MTGIIKPPRIIQKEMFTEDLLTEDLLPQGKPQNLEPIRQESGLLLPPFKTILLDPAWAFKTYSKKGMGRSAENHYPCMTLKDMNELPVKGLMAKDSVCLLWVTNPFVDKGIEMLKAYGFTYKTILTWVKLKNGKLQLTTGYHLRGSTEHLLIGTLGKGYCPKPHERLPSAILTPKHKEHSRKPEQQYQYAELYQAPYVELYARRTRRNWVSLGFDIDGEDLRDSIPALYKKIQPDFDLLTGKRIKVKSNG